ncbi:hypothetical protein AAVH_11457 [Aphelenchoides avenae]|nr:hypothetical protein AAVH_11457 [Aphelenchus avenae]
MLLVLGFLGRQTLGRVLVTNGRLTAVVNRHRKTLNLPEIPIPPRLSTRLKLLACLTVVTLLLMPVGIVHARRYTRSGLRAAGLEPGSLHKVHRFHGVSEYPAACTRTCDSQRLRCHAECDFKYTLRDASGGIVTNRTCSSIGLPTTNASPTVGLGWSCSFDYAVKEDTIDIEESEVRVFEWHWVLWTNLMLAVLASADAKLFLRMDRMIVDEYMAATGATRRDSALKDHEQLQKGFFYVSVAALILAGLCGSVALFGLNA